MNAAQKLDEILAELKAKQINAAMRGKPTMWAYYLSVRRGLNIWFTKNRDPGYVAGEALALIQEAERYQNYHSSDVAAFWAAQAVYARRILREWSAGRKLDRETRGSLAWLRARAEED